MSDRCPSCNDYKANGEPFCGSCGRNLNDAEPDKAQLSILTFFLLLATVFVIFIAIFESITLAVNASEVFGFLSDKFPIFVLVPSLQILFYVEGVELQIFWVLLTIIILSCVATAAIRFIEVARSPGGLTKPGAAENTAFFWVSVLLSAYLFITVVIVIALEMAGNEITTPDFGTNIERMFELANASVWEEIVTRLLLIGVPMMFISLVVARKKESLKCLLGGFGMSTTAIVLILISGAVFGLAHYSGWDDQAWKVLTTAIMGVFLGYLFVRFGLYAAILMHFIMDYLQSFDWMGVGALGGIVSLLIFGIGLVSLIYIVQKLVQSKEAIESLPAFRNEHVK
ncbi:MAG: CPBP family intramembrane metalloprotease [Candidatus Methanoplasma sp.]|jgi:hypothetical protein|nr:CPBP family intramembrane metalloprotease [Candidatus Methanoplasma sp.]